MPVRPGKVWLVIAGLCVVTGACITQRGGQPGKVARGLKFNHALHVEQGMDCVDCHSIEVPEPGPEPGPEPADDEAALQEPVAVPTIPDHEICGMCHEVEEETEEDDVSSCAMCHLREDRSVDATLALLDTEKVFKHEPHVDKEVECTVCHADPDKARLPSGPLMDFCVECHETNEPPSTECETCHTTLSDQARPRFRNGARLSHDVPQLWERIHGRESLIDPDFCALCHETEDASEDMCEQCHRKNAPSYHTASWRRKTHGLRAGWDRSTCAVCHEEDFCLKCHQNTQPSSHRRRWESPANGHCISCHFPAENTGCTVCHESIEHRSALPSIHSVGLFPSNCAICHPGGLPLRSPHPRNTTVRCVFCHI